MLVNIDMARALQSGIEPVIRVLLDHPLVNKIFTFLVEIWLVFVLFQTIQCLGTVRFVAMQFYHRVTSIQKSEIAGAILEFLLSNMEQQLAAAVFQKCLFISQTLRNLSTITCFVPSKMTRLSYGALIVT